LKIRWVKAEHEPHGNNETPSIIGSERLPSVALYSNIAIICDVHLTTASHALQIVFGTGTLYPPFCVM